MAGFDMVNEEDFTEQISYFTEDILEGSANIQEQTGKRMPCFFHSGETHQESCRNLHDAIALGTKRIGHGF